MTCQPATLPNPIETAQREAAAIRADRRDALYRGLDRVLRDAPRVERRLLIAGIAGYHREAMERVPSASVYPEAAPWVEYVRAVDRELIRLTGLNAEEVAVFRSLDPYLKFRGFRRAGLKAAPPRSERCRVAFLQDTDRGAMLIKNVDDTMPPNWQSLPPLPWRLPPYESSWAFSEWSGDGTGSGLHIDDEPPELFPLPVFAMLGQQARTLREAVDFLRRYSHFWGGGNQILYDRHGNAVAIEKSSHNFL